DDRFVAAVTALLEGDGRFKVIGTARNGRAAVELAATLSPDVILMDIEMPLRDGIEATRAIHAAELTAQVIAISSFDYSERALEIREAGAVDYVPKSRTRDELTGAILALRSDTRSSLQHTGKP